MINQLRFYLSQSPKSSPVNVLMGDVQFPLTAGELAEARLASCFLGACAFTLGATPDWEPFNFAESLSEYVRYMRDGG